MTRKVQKLIVAGDRACVIQPTLAKLLGRSAAHVLQHIHYTLQNPKLGKIVDDHKWIYNTYDKWHDELQIYSLSTLRRAITKLEDLGILMSAFLASKNSDRTKWYRIDYAQLEHLSAVEVLTAPVKMNNPSAQNEQITIEELKIQTNNNINPDKSKNIDVNILFEVWKENLDPTNTLTLTKKRSQLLMAAFKLKFDKSLEKWRTFCENVKTSAFLTGKTKHAFHASLEWLLRFDVIQRILEGDFGVRRSDDATQCAQMEENKDLSISIKFPEDPVLSNLHQKLIEIFGMRTYLSWFQNAQISVGEGRAQIQSPSNFWRDYVLTHFGRDLETLRVCII